MKMPAFSDTAALKGAQTISNIFHPWAMLSLVTASVAYQICGKLFICAEWTLIVLSLAFGCPLMYAKLRAAALSQDGGRRRVSRSLFRNDPAQLVTVTLLFGIPPVMALIILKGPKSLLIFFVGVAAVMLAVSLINMKYRASFHISMNTSMLTALCFIHGPVCLLLLPLLPVIGLSRYRLREHTPGQMFTGFVIGLVVSSTVFFCLGLGRGAV
jgi:hypothetical protein